MDQDSELFGPKIENGLEINCHLNMPQKHHDLFCALLCFFSLAACNPACNPDEPYMRITTSGNESQLETKISMLKRNDTLITLIGNVHLGTQEYFQTLQDKLNGFDAVLYENIATEGFEATEQSCQQASRLSNPGFDYASLAEVAGLVGQPIPWKTSANLIHADILVSKDQALQALKTFFSSPSCQSDFTDLCPDVLKYLICVEKDRNPALYSNQSDSEIMEAVFNGRKAGFRASGFTNKKRLAEPIVLDAKNFLGPRDKFKNDPNFQLAVLSRNDIVLAKIDELLKEGRARNIAVIYGAVYMPDIQTQLQMRHQFTQEGNSQWITAFSFSDSEPSLVAALSSQSLCQELADIFCASQRHTNESISTLLTSCEQGLSVGCSMEEIALLSEQIACLKTSGTSYCKEDVDLIGSVCLLFSPAISESCVTQFETLVPRNVFYGEQLFMR